MYLSYINTLCLLWKTTNSFEVHRFYVELLEIDFGKGMYF